MVRYPSTMLRLALLVSLATAACGLRSRLRRGSLHGGGAARDLAHALQSGQPYRQRLENHRELIYHGSINFGGQVVQAVFDTGSFDVVVVSQRCAHCKSPAYNSSVSETYRRDPHGYTEEHNYVSGPTVTALSYERVSVGPLVNGNQSIFEVLAHNVSILDRGIFGAVVGIGPEGHNMSNPSLLKGFGITEYSLCLQPQAGAPGWLTWRGDLTPAQKASARELPVVGRYHWALSMRDMLPVRSRQGELTDAQRSAAQTLLCGRGCAAILDSGTSLISAPSHALQGLKFLLPDLADDCSNFDDLPDLEFSLSGLKLTLPPQAYAMRLIGTPKERADAASLLHFQSKTSGNQTEVLADQCIYAFIKLDHHTDYGPLWIFGMPFFRFFHVQFGMADEPKDRRVWVSGASDTCEPLPLTNSTVDAAVDPYAKYQGYGVYPKVHVLADKRRERGGPLTIQARDVKPVRPPKGEL
mmetsp:Transcript_24117/g.63650  ORF Transcript_24117/g.63650 Transcript_24117/m.63650 type:complete len:469 (-) Transcript_24117:48-1454(-)